MSCFSSPSDDDEKPRSKAKRSPTLEMTHIEHPSSFISYRKYLSQPVGKTIISIACSNDEKLIALSYENTYMIVEVSTLIILHTWTFESDSARCLYFASDHSLWIGTFSGIVFQYVNGCLNEQYRQEYTILSIIVSFDMNYLCMSNMDMKIFYYDLRNKDLIDKMTGKAVSVDCLAFDHLGRFVSTSMEHIVHIWDADGKLVKAMIPIKESSFTNGRSYIVSDKCGTLIADKAEGRKNLGETYVWDIETERLLFTFKTYESTNIISHAKKLIYENQRDLCIYEPQKKVLEKMTFHTDEISILVGSEDFCLVGSVDGNFSINYYRSSKDDLADLLKRSAFLDLKFNWK